MTAMRVRVEMDRGRFTKYCLEYFAICKDELQYAQVKNYILATVLRRKVPIDPFPAPPKQVNIPTVTYRYAREFQSNRNYCDIDPKAIACMWQDLSLGVPTIDVLSAVKHLIFRVHNKPIGLTQKVSKILVDNWLPKMWRAYKTGTGR